MRGSTSCVGSPSKATESSSQRTSDAYPVFFYIRGSERQLVSKVGGLGQFVNSSNVSGPASSQMDVMHPETGLLADLLLHAFLVV